MVVIKQQISKYFLCGEKKNRDSFVYMSYWLPSKSFLRTTQDAGCLQLQPEFVSAIRDRASKASALLLLIITSSDKCMKSSLQQRIFFQDLQSFIKYLERKCWEVFNFFPPSSVVAKDQLAPVFAQEANKNSGLATHGWEKLQPQKATYWTTEIPFNTNDCRLMAFDDTGSNIL